MVSVAQLDDGLSVRDPVDFARHDDHRAYRRRKEVRSSFEYPKIAEKRRG